MKIKIITDSTNDLGRDLLEQLNIDVIPLTVNFDEESYLDSVEITTKELYEKVEAKGQLPKTAAVPIQKFIDVFEKYINEGYEIVYTGISKSLSRTFENAYFAAQEVNPEKIHLVDSMNLSTGIGLLVLKACKWRDEGQNVHEIADLMRETVPYVRSQFIVDTMEYLHKGGRCSGTAKVFGTLLRIVFPFCERAIHKASLPIERSVTLEWLVKTICTLLLDESDALSLSTSISLRNLYGSNPYSISSIKISPPA
jgi:DegV family protein with EDD domain